MSNPFLELDYSGEVVTIRVGDKIVAKLNAIEFAKQVNQDAVKAVLRNEPTKSIYTRPLPNDVQ